MLYTPLAVEDIFPVKEQASVKLVQYEGKMVYITENELGEIKLERLLSTNPKDYLISSYTPGTILKRDTIQHIK